MYPHLFKPRAKKNLDSLDKKMRLRILKKLAFYFSQKEPLKFAESLIDSKIGQYRFRIGDFRAIFDLEKGKIIILTIGHRKDIYK